MLPCSSFRTVVSKKLTEVVEISCVNLIDGAALLRVIYEINQGVFLTSSYKKMSSIKGAHVMRQFAHSVWYTSFSSSLPL